MAVEGVDYLPKLLIPAHKIEIGPWSYPLPPDRETQLRKESDKTQWHDS